MNKSYINKSCQLKIKSHWHQVSVNLSKKDPFYDVYFVFDADIDDVVNEATTFIGLCNGIEAGSTMSEKRYLFHERLLQQWSPSPLPWNIQSFTMEYKIKIIRLIFFFFWMYLLTLAFNFSVDGLGMKKKELFCQLHYQNMSKQFRIKYHEY